MPVTFSQSNQRFKNKRHDVTANVIIVLFEEGDAHIAYSPALDLSGYGYTDEEARASFEIALSQFLDITTKKGTLFSELKRFGWNLKDRALNIVKAPAFDDLLVTNLSLAKLLEEGKSIRTTVKPVRLFADA